MKVLKLIEPTIQLIAAYIVLCVFRRDLFKLNIWTIGEKKTEARDNGYHFFNYIVSNHPYINIYYIIMAGSPDEKKLPADKVVHYGTFKHKLYSLAAVNLIGGQSHGNRPYANISAMGYVFDRLKRKGQNLIWISHGVRKDKIRAFSPDVTPYSLFTVATQTEYDYYKKTFSIPDSKIALIGLCRFDSLHEFKTKRQILVMPTFRSWLKPKDTSKDKVSQEMAAKFVESPFYTHYMSLLSDTRLNTLLEKYKIQLVFYLHYSFQAYRTLFTCIQSPYVVIADRNDYDVQTLLKESLLLITDYSSVFFDFCYMKKPVIYYQFDREEYRERHYHEGYWSYEQGGFGPVLKDTKSVVDEIEKTINSGFTLIPEYLEKVEKFFIPYDMNNCRRLFDAIQNLKSR